MKKKIISCLMIVVVVVLSYFYAHIDKNSYIYDRNADTSTFYGTGILLEGEEIAQTFVSEEDALEGINIKVSVTGNVDDVVLNYAILSENEEQVSVGSVRASELKNNKFNKLEFPKITETKEKQYTLVLSEENSNEQNGVGFFVLPGTGHGQKLTITENETDGTMVARILSYKFDMETFVVVLGMIAFVVAFMKVLYKKFK